MEYQVNLKLNDELNEIVDGIAERRGCSRAEACRWAIEQAANSASPAAGISPHVESQIEAIGEATVEVLRLLNSAPLTDLNLIAKFLPPAAIAGRHCATKLGVADDALHEISEFRKSYQGSKQ